MLCGTKCLDSDYRNETTNQRLSISVHKTALTDYQTVNATNVSNPSNNNSPTTTNSLTQQSPALQINNSTNSILRKNRLKRMASNQSVRSDLNLKKLNENASETADDKLDTKLDQHLKNKINLNAKISINTMPIKKETVASLNPLNKINVECLNEDDKCKSMHNNLNRIATETNSLTLTTKDSQFVYQSTPDLKLCEQK